MHSFWKSSETDIRRLIAIEGLYFIAGEKMFGVMLENVICHFHPELTRNEIYIILVQRTLDDEVMEDSMRLGELHEQLDKKDCDKPEKQLEARQKETNAKVRFLRSPESLQRLLSQWGYAQ